MNSVTLGLLSLHCTRCGRAVLSVLAHGLVSPALSVACHIKFMPQERVKLLSERTAVQAAGDELQVSPGGCCDADWMSSKLQGDKVEHLMWRLQNGELPLHKHPKVVAIMIGTNGAPHLWSPLLYPLPFRAESKISPITRTQPTFLQNATLTGAGTVPRKKFLNTQLKVTQCCVRV